METLPSNYHFRSTIPHKKLLLLQTLDIKKQSLPTLKKHAPKYVRHATIVKNVCRKRDVSRLKSVFSFYFNGTIHSGEVKLNSSEIFQLIKSHKKFIKHCEGVDINPHLAKELPQLCEYELNYCESESSELYKSLVYFQALKKISFFLSGFFQNGTGNLIVPVLQKNRTRVLRAISRLRLISQLDMSFNRQSSSSLPSLLQILGSCPGFLSHLKHFAIRLLPESSARVEEDLKQDQRAQIALRFVTHLDLPDHELFEVLFKKEILENLKSLKVKFKTNYVSGMTIRRLADLEFFTKLKHFDLDFTSFSSEMENAFLESFILPQEIESVELKLRKFILADDKFKPTNDPYKIFQDGFKNHPRFQRFYNQWTDRKNFQSLVIVLEDLLDPFNCPAFALDFVKEILMRVKNLRKLHYKYHSSKKSTMITSLSMDLKEFWDCLENSKDTLEDLEIHASQRINFFENLEDLVELRNLKALKIHGNVYKGVKFGDFLRRLSKGRESVLEVVLERLCFEETKQLKDLLADLAEIPRNVHVDLGISISNLNWEEVLCAYMIRVRGEGRLKLNLELNRIMHRKILELLKEKSVRNSALKEVVIKETQLLSSWVIQKGNLYRG